MSYAKKTTKQQTKPQLKRPTKTPTIQQTKRAAAAQRRVAAAAHAIHAASRGIGQQTSRRGQSRGNQLPRRNRQVPRTSPAHRGGGTATHSRSPLIGIGNFASVKGLGMSAAAKDLPIRTYSRADGVRERAHVASTWAQYSKVPLAEGGAWTGGPGVEFERNDRDGHHLFTKVRVFLTALTALYAGTTRINSTGERITTIPLSPAAFGGRLQLFAETFISHRCIHMIIHFEPTLPATAPGALGLYFTADSSEQQFIVGLPLLQHASSSDSFRQFPIWEHGSVEIDPAHLTVSSVDEATGDLRFSTEGLLNVVLAGSVDNDGPGDLVLGNIYADVEYEFFGPMLDQDIVPSYSGTLTWTANASSTTTAYEPAYARLAAAGVNPGFSTTSAPADPNGYIAVLTVHDLTVTTTIAGLVTHLGSGSTAFTIGQSYFGRVYYNTTTTTDVLYLFDSYVAAGNLVTDPAEDSATDGQMLWAGTSAAGTYQYVVTFHARWVPMDLSTV